MDSTFFNPLIMIDVKIEGSNPRFDDQLAF